MLWLLIFGLCVAPQELTGGRMPAAFRSSLLKQLCVAAKGEPRLAAGMASSGLLWEAVRTAREAGRFEEDATPVSGTWAG